MAQLAGAVRAMIADENGATMVEYGIMLALVAAVCFGIITTLGGQIQAGFANASAGL